MNCLVRYLGLAFQLSRIQDLALWEAEMTEPTRALTSSAWIGWYEEDAAG
ncbi:hypothetical protein ACS5PJ_16135 [Pseudarthrobacter sp. YS3]|jgi:hypothetical protein